MDSEDSDPPSPGADSGCPAAPLLALLCGRWTASLLHHLGTHGPTRFGKLQRELTGISPKVLTARLRKLETDGLLWREASDDIPPKVHYGLTDKGTEVHRALRGFEAPTRRWLDAREP